MKEHFGYYCMTTNIMILNLELLKAGIHMGGSHRFWGLVNRRKNMSNNPIMLKSIVLLS